MDFDNDGRLDFCAAGAREASSSQGTVQLWRNAGGNWLDASTATGFATLQLPRHGI
jgi:hypothetical protein